MLFHLASRIFRFDLVRKPGRRFYGLTTLSIAGATVLMASNRIDRFALVKSEQLKVVDAELAFAPNVPKKIDRRDRVRLKVKLTTQVTTARITKSQKYDFWTFNGNCPGPFIRARVGDILDLEFTNRDETGMAHNIDFHAVMAPGGGAPMTLAEKDETKRAYFRLLYPGLFLYHCAANPLPSHISNGMYGLILVEPEDGLPPVDKEFYVLQSEFYAVPSDDKDSLEFSYARGLKESPTHVLFNAKEGALTDKPLMSNLGETVRIYFGNAGPNLTSSFHIIGGILNRVYANGGLVDPPARCLQTVTVPSGGACIVEMDTVVPGTFTLVDHAIFRTDKGAVGFLKVLGEQRYDIYDSDDRPANCIGCKTHD